MLTCTCPCIHSHMYTHALVHSYACTNTSVHAHTHTYTHLHIRIHISHMQTLMHVKIHTHSPACTHYPMHTMPLYAVYTQCNPIHTNACKPHTCTYKFTITVHITHMYTITREILHRYTSLHTAHTCCCHTPLPACPCQSLGNPLQYGPGQGSCICSQFLHSPAGGPQGILVSVSTAHFPSPQPNSGESTSVEVLEATGAGKLLEAGCPISQTAVPTLATLHVPELLPGCGS